MSLIRFILLGCLVACRWGGDSLFGEESSPPNILMLLSDDHSYPFVGTYGDPNVTTPNLDQLAIEGIKFHRFFTAAPQCVPSRATLMTGRSPVAARITRFSSPLAPDEVTLPELLRAQADYYTGVCGRSYHLDGSGNRAGPGIGALLDKHKLRTFKERVDFLNTCADDQVPGQVAQFLDQCPANKPFFLWANFSDPHHVWNAPASLRPDPAQLKLPPQWPDMPGMREEFADYCAEINRLDGTIGKVLKVLEAKGLKEKTLIVFLGDNGAALPKGKGSLYDLGSNVPCIVRWPGKVAPKRESRALLSGEDLAPTLLAAAGVKAPSKMTGESFLSLLLGETFTPREYLFIERGPHGSAPVTVNMKNSGYDLSRAVRSDRFKLIYNCTPWIPYSPVDSARGPAWQQITKASEAKTLDAPFESAYFTSPRPVYELYDLDADPGELVNLSGNKKYAEIEKALRYAMAEKMILDFDYLPLPALQE